jgi:thermitase
MFRWKCAARAGLLLTLFACVLVSTTARAQVAPPAFVPGRVLVQFKLGTSATREQEIVAEDGGESDREIAPIGVHIVQLRPNTSPVAAARAFGQHREVAFAEPDRILPPALVPNDTWYSSTWHLPKISAPAAWDTTTGSSAVTIAILDTGVDGAHPDLAPKMVPGWNFYDNNADTSDVYGHGTAVAGTAAACSNNGFGVASIAWGCKILPIRVSDVNGFATFSALASGITYAADHGARVANASFQASNSATIDSAALYMQGKGGVVTISAGNDGTLVTSPDDPYVLTVSATDSSDLLASWSTTGNNIDLSAPGVSVMTTLRGGGCGSGSGTSFSAPVVAGVAALVISVNPALTAAQVQNVLKQGADDLGNPGWDPSYGAGRVNAARAVSLAGGPGGTTDTTPPTVSFNSPGAGATVSGTVSVQVNAGDNVGVASVSVSVDGGSPATDTTAPYSFTWDTTGWANGSHTLTATATDTSGNTATASIIVTVNNVADTTAPTISITSPTAGATVSGMVSVLVSTFDNVGVVKVELYVDGALTSTATSAPFTTKWNARKAAAAAHTLQSKAYDAAGNVGVSGAVTVNR